MKESKRAQKANSGLLQNPNYKTKQGACLGAEKSLHGKKGRH